ncbi:unnamed protein product [Pleuronectes platessa]|uniref:Uncharacterized protein n=1 Tax=Pleuronectes platessa TaxID=8262 RepID=A0A9N7TL91_PLEPL|nr:unnamed protein product [Pleuronectes platessa]
MSVSAETELAQIHRAFASCCFTEDDRSCADVPQMSRGVHRPDGTCGPVVLVRPRGVLPGTSLGQRLYSELLIISPGRSHLVSLPRTQDQDQDQDQRATW